VSRPFGTWNGVEAHPLFPGVGLHAIGGLERELYRFVETRHPAVLQAAAFPMPDERLGEKVGIAVVLREGSALAGGELLAHLDERGISRYDMPEFFAVLDTIPMTPSGKYFKRGLIEQVRDGRVKPEAVRWHG